MFKANQGLNPILQFVRIGSTVRGNTGEFRTSVIKEPVTYFLAGQRVEKMLSGESAYVYNDSLNQGSMGISGSYGISAVSKVSSALTAYAGKSAATSSKTVMLNYSVRMVVGVEHINFGGLTPADLINALNSSAKADILDVLDKFNAINALIGNQSLTDYLLKPGNKTEVEKAVTAWCNAINKFTSGERHGDGLVVGIIWGGIGMVSLKIFEEKTEDTWKYGGKGNFTYSGITTSATVESAYDGSQADRRTDVKVIATQESLGACVAKDVETWFSLVANKAFDAIAKIDLLQQAPNVISSSTLPSVPAFTTPPKDPKVTDKIDKITDMAGLEAFAQASAFEDAKKKDPTLTLAAFLNQASQPVQNPQVSNLPATVTQSSIPVDQVTPLKAAGDKAEEEVSAAGNGIEMEELRGIDDFTPLGVWVCNWADIFPWLSMGYLNQLGDTAFAEEILQRQCMIQDLLTLGRMYRIFKTCKIPATDFAPGMADFSQIADSFDNQVAHLQEDPSLTIQQAYNTLGADAKKVYDHWNKVKFLRDAELGLGVISKGKSVSDVIESIEGVPGKPPSFSTITLKTENCEFTGASYASFAGFLKVLPLITPQGKIYVFGPVDSLLKGVNDKGAQFGKRVATALEFKVDAAQKVLKAGDITLYPIPYSAAKGVPLWKGQSLSTNLNSMAPLREQLKDVEKQLSNLNMYSFSSDNWDASQKLQDHYSINALKTQYIGMVAKTPGIFNG